MSVTYIPAALRKAVEKRAEGRCEYCLIPNSVALISYQIDHVIAEKHGGETEIENLALSCSLCNKLKGSDLTSIDDETGKIEPLFNPRIQKWVEHFEIKNAEITPLTSQGRVTVKLLRLNTSERVAERKTLIEAGLIKIP